jgi:hypothetical protein
MMRALLGIALALTLLACSEEEPAPSEPQAGASAGDGDGDGDGDAPPARDVVYLSPTEHLTRASLALRGLRPLRDELEAAAEDPNWVEAIIDYYLSTPEIGLVIREMHEEALLTGVDPVIYPAGFPAIGALAGRDMQAINTSVVQAPVRLIEHVVLEDRPYTEIVTADYTYADDNVATIWGLPYQADGEAWQETRYEDGRPHAGILSDSFLFTRHSTTFSNKSRGRANAISRALLCYDFLSREIPIDSTIDLADPEAVANAVEQNPACVSCHQTLDPLAAYFSSFYPIYVPSQLDRYPFSSFEPAFTQLFRAADPGYFGIATGDLRDLGASIAADPRFTLCAAKRFYSHLAQVDLSDVPNALASELQSVLIDSGMSAKALLKAVVMSDAFRVSHAKQDAPAEVADETRGLLRVRPSALARSVERLTGFRWRTHLPIDIGTGGQVGEIDLMEDSFFGFEVLAGGMDGVSVTQPSTTTSATTTLVAESLASLAAEHVVEADLRESDKSRRHLLSLVDASTTDEASVRAQLVDLSLLLYGQKIAAEDTAITEASALFFDVLGPSSAPVPRQIERAWEITLYAMLQDPRFLHY